MILLVDGEKSIEVAVVDFADSVDQTLVRSPNFDQAVSLLKANREFSFLVLNAQDNEKPVRGLIESIGQEGELAGLHTIAVGLAGGQFEAEDEQKGASIYYLAPPVVDANVFGFLSNVWVKLHQRESEEEISRVAMPTSARPLIAWKADYNIGVEPIDRQHKQLVEIINVLHNSTRLGSSREVLWDVLVSLIKYTKIHFETEEQIFKKYKYPGYDEHKKDHEKLTAQVSNFSKAFIQRRIDISPNLMEFLKAWLMDHVLDLDRKSRQFLKDSGAN